jgi:hypothetical protein
MEERIKLTPNEFKRYLEYVGGQGELLQRISKFKDKIIVVNSSINLSGIKTYSLGKLMVNGDLHIGSKNDISDLYNVTVTRKIYGNDLLILKTYYDTGYDDILENLPYDITVNPETDRLNTELVFNFSSIGEFCKFIGYREGESHTADHIYQTHNDFYETNNEEMEEGYIYRWFNEENKKTMITLTKLFLPDLTINNFVDIQKNSNIIYSRMNEAFSEEFDDIINEYFVQVNRATSDAIDNELESVFTDFISDFGLVEYSQFSSYGITIGSLLSLFEEHPGKVKISTLLDTISSFKPDIYEIQFNVNYDEDFDDIDFNRSVERNLESILEKINNHIENYDKNYLDMFDLLNRNNFKNGVLYELPKDKTKSFYIKGYDFDKNKLHVNIRDSKTNSTSDGYYDLENFKLLLYHPELF